MSADLDLYQELILDHNKHPRNRRTLPCADRQCDGYNPLCGDRVTVYLKIHDGVVEDVSFEGTGCAISTASASLMTEAVKGKTVDQAKAMFERFHQLIRDPAGGDPSGRDLGKLAVFAGVSKYPARVKCATLVWHTLKSALDSDEHSAVSTE